MLSPTRFTWMCIAAKGISDHTHPPLNLDETDHVGVVLLLPVAVDKKPILMRSRRGLLFLLVLTCLQVGLLCVETRAQVTCRVASLDYPSEVKGGRSFTLTATVDYSFPYGTYSIRVDVFEGSSQTGTIYFKDAVAQGESTSVSGTGSRRLSVQLTAPFSSKEWLLTFYAHYQAWYGGTSWYRTGEGYKTFTVSVYTKCQVWLKTSPSEVARYAKMSGEGQYDPETYVTLKADKIVSGATGTRYVFLYWMVDGVRYDTEAATIHVDRRQITAVAEFKVQYQLVVKSEFGTPQGSGWYDERSVAMFSVTSPVGFGIQQVFERWSGDSSSTSPQSTVLMNSPKTVVAVWRPDYTVLIFIVLGVVGGSVAIVGFMVYSRRKKAAAPAAPLGVVHPEAGPAGIPSKPVPEAAAVKEVKEVPVPKMIPITEQAPTLDDRVYNYIVEHEGTIALSQAAKDLGISLSELNATIERLRSQGRLG